MVERRVEISPSWPFRLPRMLGRDATMVRRAGVLHRLMHVEDEPVVVRAAQPVARPRRHRRAGRGRRRLRGGDRAHALRARRRRRPARRSTSASATTRYRPGRARAAVAAPDAPARAVRGAGLGGHRAAHRLPARGGDPAADRRAARAPLRAHRAARPAVGGDARRAGAGAARGVRPRRPPRARRWSARRARSPPGRVDLRAPDHEAGWRRLRAIPGDRLVDARDPRLPRAGPDGRAPGRRPDLIKLVGRLRVRRRPDARATEDEVREFFAPYAPWAGLAATYATGLRAAGPHPAGTRSSARVAGPLAA